MDIQVTPLYKRIENVQARVLLLRGGARSSKSFSLVQKAVLWLYTGRINGEYVPEGSFTIIRLTFPALRSTIYRDFTEYLFELGLYHKMDHRRTVHEFHYGRRFVAFIPADDPQKLRGRKHTFALFEECNDVPYEAFHQVAMRTDKQIMLTTNPSGHPWARTEIEEKRMHDIGDVHLDVSTYKDNPFLSDSIITEIENLKYTDDQLYRIYTLGEWTDLKGLIFPNTEQIEVVPDGGKTYYGLDFGWNDPSVLMRVDIIGKNIFVDCLFYRSELLLDELSALTKEHIGAAPVYCDSSEPRTIEELKKRGVRARKAKKGPDSIRQGLTFMKQHKIYVTERSVDTIEEWQKYKWQEKDNVIIDKPIDDFNHCADACRYALTKALSAGVTLL
jgi:phage terminase large subunit